MTNFEYIKKRCVTPGAMAKFLNRWNCGECEYGSSYSVDGYPICSRHENNCCVIGLREWLEAEYDES